MFQQNVNNHHIINNIMQKILFQYFVKNDFSQRIYFQWSVFLWYDIPAVKQIRRVIFELHDFGKRITLPSAIQS